MKAIRIHQFGPTEDVLQYEDVPLPAPKVGEVLIKVEAVSLNRADLGLRKGTFSVSADALPLIPGREFAGTVEKLGAGVSEYQVGQRVVAYPGLGGYAEYAVAKTSAVRPIPDGVTSVQASATQRSKSPNILARKSSPPPAAKRNVEDCDNWALISPSTSPKPTLCRKSCTSRRIAVSMSCWR